MRPEALSQACGVSLTVEELSRGEKKEKKEKKKTAYLTGLRVEFGQSFPTVPTRRSSGGVDGESNSPVINTTVKSRLLIILFSVCLRGLSSSRRKSAWSCVSHRGNGVDAFFLHSIFFYSRLFFFSFFIFTLRDEQGVRNGGAGSWSVCVY